MPKQAYLKLDTEKFLELWITHLKKSKSEGQPPMLQFFANIVAQAFRDAPENVEYKKAHGPDSIAGELIWPKVLNKCRSINASLKKKTGKTLPVPQGAGRESRKSVADILGGIEGGEDWLA
jgi:hypothetical protein